ncbi:hemerythrin domain-containing protein, partial [bacterium]|nr:hemerythrin domain-containing protein [bacterium]
KHLAEFSEAVAAHHGASEIAGTLDFLVDYMDFHFKTEEKHMRANNYPELEPHLERHGEFTRTLEGLAEDFKEEGATASLAEAINTMLINLFIKHIEAVDQQFGVFLKGKGVVLEEEA